ncbi:hypothetical protein [Nodularia sp. LEGE 04288]|nr:hypothetical protein [Nodularia sp. LEGE 04288]
MAFRCGGGDTPLGVSFAIARCTVPEAMPFHCAGGNCLTMI